jgi:hypothetical protein
MIQRGYIVLIIGGVLFVLGIVIATVWVIPLASVFLQQNTLIYQTSITPGQTVQATTRVTDISRPISVAIHIQGLEGMGMILLDEDEEGEIGNVQQQEQIDREFLRMVETVQDPSGIVVSRNEFSTNLFTTFQPQNTGIHILNITNVGAAPITIDATFGYMPFITSAMPPSSSTPDFEVGDQQQMPPVIDFSSLSAVIAGGLLTTIGFFTIIAGIVIVVIDRRKGEGEDGGSGGKEYRGNSNRDNDRGFSEEGITYRKD